MVASSDFQKIMNDIQTSSSLTRRSFIKRSVVAAVAVSSMTIFSGLVRASNYNPPPVVKKCSVKTKDILIDDVYSWTLCWYDNARESCKNNSKICGKSLTPDPDSGIAADEFVVCLLHKSEQTAQMCDTR